MQMHTANSIAETFDVTPVQTRQVLAPRVPAVAALATARRAPYRRKKLKWRTRDSQASQLYNLELDVMDLKQEIQRLVDYRQILNSRAFNQRNAVDGYYVKVVMEYYRVFQKGYRPGSAIDAVQFVMQAMDENMTIGPFSGRDVILHQWQQYTKALSGIDVRFLRSRVVSGEGQTIVTCYASYKYVVTQDTLEVLFPEALHRHPRIVSKILGRVFQPEGRFHFIFDSETHRIVSFNFELDFMKEFAPLLQDPRDVSTFFQDARISEECLIGDHASYDGVEAKTEHDSYEDAQVEDKAAFPLEYEEKLPWGYDSYDQEHRQPSPAGRVALNDTADDTYYL
ncbi:hypothetical protein PHYSODRAFT_262368 [Phytophthora sojae]|uniref:Uncharacterized protein n=1 Tax=Phytophthora sojae (strain P6497) TaxID=1094619 RepID=G4ZLG6_PHYSP|nr:hypothetical protein PHYSODRAFT_262368 [Phytophthora sojae]EGZ16248.1 hypothetical protein PHYSODRAFT_262368 [Phytophthora sojae]|eukprot:XP_009529997.1 hypothetical protein PHYSODRAFT_262368 [Phytophthora sojae]